MANVTKKPYLLTVLTGPNAGAQERLSQGRFKIAGDGDADFLLDDLPGEPIELAVAKGRLRLKSDRDDVALSKLGTVVPGMAAFAEMPATLQIGPMIQIHICRDVAPVKKRGLGRRVLATTACLGALGFAAFAATGFQTPVISEAMASILNPVEAAEPEPMTVARVEPAAPEPVAAAAPPLPTLQDALDMIESNIADASLSGLRVTSSDGALRLTGSMTEDQGKAWRSIRTAYEKTYGQIAPLLIDVSEVVEVAPVAIASIWLGDAAEFTTPEGKIFRVGDETPSGWTVTEIQATAVALSRGQQRALVEF